MPTHDEWKKIGKSNRRNGYRAEVKVVKTLQELGLPVQRIPLSGATKFQKGDVYIGDPLMRGKFDRTIEVKRRNTGFSTIYNLMEESETPIMAIYTPHKSVLFVLTAEEFAKLYKRAAR